MDYIRNVSLHFQEGVDVNHVGDSRYLNPKAAAYAIAINATSWTQLPLRYRYCSAIAQAASRLLHRQGNWIATAATINDFASNGLDSGFALLEFFRCRQAALHQCLV